MLCYSSSTYQTVLPHVNQAWTALHEVPYERFHEGGPAVLVSNGTTASYVPPHHIIKTQAFQQALPVYASCPHFVQLGTCMLGASCGLVHPVQLRAPVLPAYSAVLPTMGGAALTPTSIMYITPTSSVVVPQGTPLQPQPATAPQQGLPAWPSAQVPSAMRPPTVLSTLFQPADAPLDTTRILRFSNCRQRRGNKPLIVPPPAAGDTEPGPRQLIVNYLAPRVDTDGLRQLFEAFGEVEDALVVTDLRTGASRGFGFVVFTRSTVAASVIHAASGRVLLGKRIRIGYINPQFPVNEGLSLSDIARTLEPLLCSDEAMTDDTSNDASHDQSMSGTVMDDDTPTPGATPLEAVSMEGDFLCTSAHFQESL